ncbi:hypothetical protein DFH07DRAFT_945240 [Mycena maculata]|uniref:Uncharacterized protein n=1 Tax=Mycena maculata TaxID=230809 RepID=A0AAD7MTE0_9AGAR|nr:hypothetical protein DFH07DRAFT_945240 [Mycena maculata]
MNCRRIGGFLGGAEWAAKGAHDVRPHRRCDDGRKSAKSVSTRCRYEGMVDFDEGRCGWPGQRQQIACDLSRQSDSPLEKVRFQVFGPAHPEILFVDTKASKYVGRLKWDDTPDKQIPAAKSGQGPKEVKWEEITDDKESESPRGRKKPVVPFRLRLFSIGCPRLGCGGTWRGMCTKLSSLEDERFRRIAFAFRALGTIKTRLFGMRGKVECQGRGMPSGNLRNSFYVNQGPNEEIGTSKICQINDFSETDPKILRKAKKKIAKITYVTWERFVPKSIPTGQRGTHNSVQPAQNIEKNNSSWEKLRSISNFAAICLWFELGTCAISSSQRCIDSSPRSLRRGWSWKVPILRLCVKTWQDSFQVLQTTGLAHAGKPQNFSDHISGQHDGAKTANPALVISRPSEDVQRGPNMQLSHGVHRTPSGDPAKQVKNHQSLAQVLKSSNFLSLLLGPVDSQAFLLPPPIGLPQLRHASSQAAISKGTARHVVSGKSRHVPIIHNETLRNSWEYSETVSLAKFLFSRGNQIS